MTILRTSSEIKTALRDIYSQIVDKYDIKRRERRITAMVARQLKPPVCAACGRKASNTFCLEAAHISPLAECSKTKEENLLFLCKEKDKSKQLGCHTLFDQGYCSIQAITSCRKQWKAEKPATLRVQMLKLRELYGPQPQLLGHLGKQLKNLRHKQDSFSTSSEEWNSLQIQVAELTRRRARRDALQKAEKEISEVDRNHLKSSPLRSRYHYEKAYIELLSGRLDKAFEDFLLGRNALDSDLNGRGNRWRWAAHTSLLAQISCIMRYKGSNKKWSWKDIEKELSKGLRYSRQAVNEAVELLKADDSQASRMDYRNASRWVQNCLVHLVKPYIATGKLDLASRQWNKAKQNWLSMDVSSGWDSGFRATHLWLYGKLLYEQGRIDDAIHHLVRSLVLLLGARRQQPEGIRDLLFTLADALGRKKDPRHKSIRSVASRCYEFSSWFNPYIPGTTIRKLEFSK